MTDSTLLIWLVGVPALAAVLEFLSGRRLPRLTGKIGIAGALASFVLAVQLLRQLLADGNISALGNQLRADALSGLVAVVVTFVGLAAVLFAYPYLRHEVDSGKIHPRQLPTYYGLSLAFICTMVAVTVTNNIIMMYVLVEATTLASALLVTYYKTPEALEAGYKYLLLCSVGIGLGLLGCVLLYASAAPYLGGERAMEISEIARVAHQFPPLVVLLGGLLIIVGFGSKAGLVPFHAWLPDAHSQSPSPVSAMLSGITLKVALYAIARTTTMFYPTVGALSLFCVVIGAATMLFGIIVAFHQTDLKRMLAYSSVSQVGYIIMGLGFGSYLGFYGAIYHIVNHALNKSMLFLCAGVLLYTCGSTNIVELGKKKHSAWLAIIFFIGALGVGGVPPLNGFWSKFAIYTAAAQSHLWWAFGIALATSLLTLAVLIRAGYTIFLQNHHDIHGATSFVAAMAMTSASDGENSAMSEHSTKHHSLSIEENAHAVPFGMMAVISIMALLVFLTGLNLGGLPQVIDLAARALLHQMAGG